MTKTIKELGNDLAAVAHNPQAMARVVLNELEKGGQTLTTPGDPILFAIESSVMSAHAVIQSINNTLPKAFSSMATTHKDIYRHLSDKDALNIFALPSLTEFQWVFDVAELRSLARVVEGSEVRKLVIPVNTEYRAKEIIFSQPYPLEIRFLAHDNIQVRWDTSYVNPFTSIAPGPVEFELANIRYEGANIQTLRIYVPVEQYSLRYLTSNTIPNIVWSETFTLTDEFFATRVRVRTNSQWSDLKVALSIDAIDPLTPTVVIEPTKKAVKMTIPEIYINSGLVTGEISIEILETKGEMSRNFANYVPSDFSYVFKDHLRATPSEFTNVFKQLQLAQTFNPGTVTGGRKPLGFEELRSRVIANTLGEIKQPLTNDELESVLRDKGYGVFKAVDTIASRIYLAAINLPDSNISTISGPIGCVNDNVRISLTQLNSYPGVRVNGNRFTLTNECLFRQTGANTSLFEPQTLKTINWLTNVDKIDYFSDKQLLSLPYHVVIDMNNNVVEARSYSLSKPKMVSRQIENTNDNLTLVVSTKIAELTMNETGYRLRCLVKCNDQYRDTDPDRLDAYISIVTSTGRVFKKGILVGAVEDDYLWEWNIETNLDIDRKDNLIVNGFRDSSNASYDMAIGLESTFNVVYSILGTYDNELKTEADDYLPSGYSGVAITREAHNLHFGEAMTNMWNYARPVPGTLQYKKYAEDVPAVYTQDVKLAKPGGGYEYEIIDGEPVFKVKHHAGDPIYNKDGTPRIRHHKGDTVLDSENNPIIIEKSKVEIEVDLWLVDARFMVTTVKEVYDYNDEWYGYINNHEKVVIPEIAGQALDRTKLKLTALNTISRVKVMLGNEVVTMIPAEQKFSIKYYVTDDIRQNQALLGQIKKTTNQIINSTLKGATVISSVTIGEALKKGLGEFVKGVIVDKFDYAENTDYISVLDHNASISIAKRLTLTTDNNLTIEDDISISYLKHRK